jgi:hypothetical protein
MKETQVVECGEAPLVRVTVAGDLRVGGWERSEVAAEGVEAGNGAVWLDDDGTVHVESDGDLRLRVPYGARLSVDAVGGDARVAEVHGEVELATVGGDLVLRGVGPATLDEVGGDLSARDLAGSLTVSQVGADLSAGGIAGDVTVGRVGADLAVRDVEGALTVDAVGADASIRRVTGSVVVVAGSDARLALEPVPGESYRVSAGAGIRCVVAPDSHADVWIQSGAGVRVDTPELQMKPDSSTTAAQFRLGDGGPEIRLTSGGTVAFLAREGGSGVEEEAGYQFGEEFAAMAEELARHIEQRVHGATEAMNARMARLSVQLPGMLGAAGLSPEEAERIAERAQREIERAAERAEQRAAEAIRRAEQKLHSAQRKAERHARRAERHAERHPRSWGGGPGGPRGWVAPPPRPPRAPEPPPVSEEERLSILRMLQEKKITVDQAETLLAALEGRAP